MKSDISIIIIHIFLARIIISFPLSSHLVSSRSSFDFSSFSPSVSCSILAFSSAGRALIRDWRQRKFSSINPSKSRMELQRFEGKIYNKQKHVSFVYCTELYTTLPTYTKTLKNCSLWKQVFFPILGNIESLPSTLHRKNFKTEVSLSSESKCFWSKLRQRNLEMLLTSFGFVFEENSVRKIIWFSLCHGHSKVMLSKYFPTTNFSCFKSIFEKLHFHDELVWMTGLTAEIKLRSNCSGIGRTQP